MSSDSVLNEDTKSTSLLADETDDSCVFGYIEIVPLTRDTDGACTTECDSGDWSAQVKQENLPVVKQEPHDVRGVVLCDSSLLISVRETNSPHLMKIIGHQLCLHLYNFFENSNIDVFNYCMGN